MLTQYPASLNFEAVAAFGKAAALAAQGKFDEIDGANAVHAAWDVSGYGLSVWKPDPLIIMKTGPVTVDDYDKVVKACTDFCKAPVALPGAPVDEFPWPTMLAVALQIIQWFLTKK